MPAVVVLIVPMLVCALFAGAIHTFARRMPEAAHLQSWLAGFWLLALGWAAAGIEFTLAVRLVFPGVAVDLCWLAAALLGARGVRQRAHRADRGIVLLAIWVGTAVGSTILLDLGGVDSGASAAMALVIVAIGAALGAVAVGPRHRSAPRSVWIAAAALGAFALAELALGLLVLTGSAPAATAETTSLVSMPVIVLSGLAAVLWLTEDRANQLQRLARTDPLTGVWNRRGFEEAAAHLLARLYGAGGNVAAVAIADIDGFKGINDAHGHAVGDQALIRFAETLRTAVEPGDLLARLGGEEFAILAIGIQGPELQQRMERVRGLLSVPSIDPKGPPAITASFGVAPLDHEHRSLREALERADRALYRAKSDGRNRVRLAE